MFDVIVMSAFGIILVTLCTVGTYYYSKAQCKATAEAMNKSYQYSLFTDCLIKVDDGWVPLRSYRTIN